MESWYIMLTFPLSIINNFFHIKSADSLFFQSYVLHCDLIFDRKRWARSFPLIFKETINDPLFLIQTHIQIIRINFLNFFLEFYSDSSNIFNRVEHWFKIIEVSIWNRCRANPCYVCFFIEESYWLIVVKFFKGICWVKHNLFNKTDRITLCVCYTWTSSTRALWPVKSIFNTEGTIDDRNQICIFTDVGSLIGINVEELWFNIKESIRNASILMRDLIECGDSFSNFDECTVELILPTKGILIQELKECSIALLFSKNKEGNKKGEEFEYHEMKGFLINIISCIWWWKEKLYTIIMSIDLCE